MIDFDFIRSEFSKKQSDGTIRIYGALLDELKNLKRGQVLELTDKKGHRFAVLNFDDLPVGTTDQRNDQ